MKFVIAIEPGTTTAFGVVVPDLPGCFSSGDTLDKAVDNAREAIELWCQTVIEDGGNIPAAKTFAEHQANPDFVGWIWAVVECRQPCKTLKAAVSHHDREVAELRADCELAVEYLKAAMESLDDPDDRTAGLLALRAVVEAYGGPGAAVPEGAVVSSDSKLGLARVGQETLPDKFFKRGKEIAKLADQGKRIPCERIIAFEDPEDLARHIPVQRKGNMKLHILSDLHLEFSAFAPPATDADVIVLAGDIDKGNKGVYWARETFPDKPILYVPGNHEFYGYRRPETLAMMRDAAQQVGVHLLDEDELIIGNVRFLGCTLWTDFMLFGEVKKSTAMSDGQLCLNDFRVIREGVKRPFTPARSIEIHKQSLAWLKTKLDEPFDGKTVVVTHHLPSKQSVVDRFKEALLSACFASELDYLFGKMDIWIHGHTHDNLDYEVNGTRVICNPRGYVTYHGTENFDFNPGLVVEL